MEKLLQLGIINMQSPEAKDHLSCEGVGISPHMVCKFLGLAEQSKEHKLVLQILVRYVSHSSLYVEDVVDHLVNHPPCGSVWLDLVSLYEEDTSMIRWEGPGCTMRRTRNPPLANVDPMNISGLDE